MLSLFKSRKIPSELRVVFYLIVLVWAGIFLISGILFSGFHFIDDHEIVLINYELTVKKLNLFTMIDERLHQDPGGNRLRPLYFIHRILAIALLGEKWFFWYLYNAILAIITTFAFYVFGRLIKFSIPESLFISGLCLLGGGATIWWRLGTPETIAVPLVAIAFVSAALAARSTAWIYEILFIVFSVLSSLSKEAMIVFIPALICLRIGLEYYFNQCSFIQVIKRCRFSIFGLGLVLGLELFYLYQVVGIGGTGYAGIDQNTLNFNRLGEAGFSLFKTGFLWVPLLAILLWVIVAAVRREKKKIDFKPLLAVSLIFIVAVVPQIIVYAKSGFTGHYFLPVLIPCALLSIFILWWLRQDHLLLSRIVFGIILFAIGLNFSQTLNTAQIFAQDGFITRDLFANIEACAAGDQPILVVANPRVAYEKAISLRRYLLYHSGRSNLFLSTYGLEKADFYSTALGEAESFWGFLDPQDLQKTYLNQSIDQISRKSEIKAIVILDADKLAPDFLSSSRDWFNPAEFDLKEYQMGYASVSAKVYCQKS
jgi:hypothetical protein